MDEKMQEQFVEAFEEMAIKFGAESYEQGLDRAIRLTQHLADFMGTIRTKAEFRALLQSMEKPTWSEDKKIRFAIRFFPRFVRIFCVLLTSKFLADLPAFAPGRPQKLSAVGSNEMLEFMYGLHRKRVPLAIIKKRAAMRFGCSPRSAERVWAARDEPRTEVATAAEVSDWISDQL